MKLYLSKCSIWFRLLFCLCVSLLCAASVISALPTKGEEAVYDRVIRLHVLANSDTEEDQALKLRVRNAILAFLREQSLQCSSADEAQSVYASLLPQIENVARDTVQTAGYDYACHATLTEEIYPPRTYNAVTLPAGTYRSLRVMIGKASGQNWWCVLFPPLCLSLAAEPNEAPAAAVTEGGEVTAEEVLLAAGFTPYEVSLIAGDTVSETKTVVRFRIVEWLRRLFSRE